MKPVDQLADFTWRVALEQKKRDVQAAEVTLDLLQATQKEIVGSQGSPKEGASVKQTISSTCSSRAVSAA